MSAITSNTSSLTGASYATQLAQASAIKRSLANLGTAIQSGDLAPANTILAAFFKANPQYVTAPSDDSSSQNPLNQDFQNLATALSNNQVGAAQTAWAQIKTDFASQGVTNLDSGASSTAQVVAQATESMDTEILSDMFGTASGDSSSIATLLGGSTGADASSQAGLTSSLINQWLTYQQTGNVAPASTFTSASNLLNIAA